jgi:polysaccharide biosynthesis protein VpsJ
MTSEPSTEALIRIRSWGEARDWKGYDPYDALNSPFAPYLTLGTRIGRRVLTQGVKLSPLNLRPALRIAPAWNAKAIALVASGYARLWAASGDESARDQARRWLGWLVANSTADVGLGWGYHFDVQTRFFAYRRGTPNIIATSFASHALLDGRELLGDEEWGEAASRASDFLVGTLLQDDGARTYFRYLPAERELVHNANVLGCSVLARTAAVTGRNELREIAAAALQPSLAAQRPDGAWPYAEGEGHGWVDNFHTGYVLEGLAACEPVVGGIRESLERGLDYWERELFLADGTPKYFAGQALPEESHNYAQAIETWLAVSAWRPGAVASASRAATQLVERMLVADGHVAFQKRRLWTSKVPFVRWTTAPAFRALARLELVRSRAAAEPSA